MTLRLVDLDAGGVDASHADARFGSDMLVCRTRDPRALVAHSGLVDAAALTLTDFHGARQRREQAGDDRRVVAVDDLDAACEAISVRVDQSPVAARTCDDVLRANASHGMVFPGLVTESLAYSALQGGSEFAEWLQVQPPRLRHEAPDSVLLRLDDTGRTLFIAFNRPDKHNAFSNSLRAGLLDGLELALRDPCVESCVFSGRGLSFCSGGDLREFGLFENVAESHLARTRYSPARALEGVRRRLGERLVAEVHGAVMGSGLEMAAFCGTVRADSTARFGLPELSMGLIPGAGGTVSVTRRIGRWRTFYLIASGEVIDVGTAVSWGLVDDEVQGDVFARRHQ